MPSKIETLSLSTAALSSSPESSVQVHKPLTREAGYRLGLIALSTRELELISPPPVKRPEIDYFKVPCGILEASNE